MANSKITGLPAAGALAGTEPLPVVQAAATKQSTISAILTYITANISLAASAITSGALALARGGTGASLADPNADRILFWDDSAGNVDWLTAGTGLSISGTTMTASGGYTQGCRVYNNAALTISNNTITALTFNSERYDTDTMHDTGSNTGRITFTTAGKYTVGACVRWVSSAVGVRYVFIRLNGTTNIAVVSDPANANTFPDQVVNTIYDFAATDYIEVTVLQSSGGNLDVSNNGNTSPEFWAQRIG